MLELIHVRDALFYYGSAIRPSGPAVLRGFAMAVNEGECFCLLGPSGCGKSTVLRLVAGFDFPQGGTVTLQDREITGPGAERSVVFQGDDSLFDWLTAIENVAFGLKMRGLGRQERASLAQQFMHLVGLRGEELKYPGELSGGMKQRIQIARVLANDPKILLMDEPFAALDAQTRAELQEELARIWEETGKTILFITHDIGEAILLGSRIAVMRAGPDSNIREVFDVNLPRPRSRADPRFGVLYEDINRLIKEEVRSSRKVADEGR